MSDSNHMNEQLKPFQQTIQATKTIKLHKRYRMVFANESLKRFKRHKRQKQ